MNSPDKDASRDINNLLGVDKPRGHRARWLLLPALLLVAAAAWFWGAGSEPVATRFVTETVQRGDLVVTVTATGTLEPTNQVDVGSELSGIVKEVLVDDNDMVKVGQVLARLDTTKLTSQVVKSRAALKSAEAKVLQARATEREAKAELARLRKVSELSGGKLPARSEIDAAEAGWERAGADVASAEASVAEAQATLESNATDLEKATIVSPINGVVLLRDVEPGQTVAASLQAPVLFTLAEDLARMELRVDVDEADVGLVREGQPATFTVDAYPDVQFPTTVTQVRYGSDTTDGVVTYQTVMAVNNDDLSLRPGMTATAEITVQKRSGVLLVPNTALRFTPPAQNPAERTGGSGFISSLLPRPPRRSNGGRAEKPLTRGAGKRVWVLKDGAAEPLTITTGTSDGRLTEVVDGPLEAGMAVIVDLQGTTR